MLNLDTLQESEVPSLDDAMLCAAVAKWCEGWESDILSGYVFPPSYTSCGDAMLRLIVKYDISLLEDPRGFRGQCLGKWGARAAHNSEMHINANPPRAVAEAALCVELRKQTERSD